MLARLRPSLGLDEFVAVWKKSSDKEDILRFEKEFAALMNVKHAVAFPYGRTGLMMLLKALGLQNKEIICPAYTCVVVPHAVVFSGNEPIFIDSQEDDFNMNLELAEQAINEKTGAMIATSIFGYPVDAEKIDKIREKYKQIFIIQDCAHSFAAEWKGIPVHKIGDAAIFGLNISKLIHSIFGGMVVTDQDCLAERLRILREQYVQKASLCKTWKRRVYMTTVYPTFTPLIYSIVNKLERSGVLDKFTQYYNDSIIDMPEDYLMGMTGVEANVGRIQLQKYQQIINHRREIVQSYDEKLKGIDKIKLPPLVDGATYSHYVVRVRNRENLLAFMIERGVQLGKLIEYCIPEMNAYKNRSGNRFSYPIASKLAGETINLPVWINKKQVLENVIPLLCQFHGVENR